VGDGGDVQDDVSFDMESADAMTATPSATETGDSGKEGARRRGRPTRQRRLRR
jgi:hypothetical protein